MSTTGSAEPNTSQLFLGGTQRNLAAWAVIIAAFVFGLGAWFVAWPLRASAVNEDGITVLRFAVALLAWAQVLSLIAIVFYLRDILLTVRRSRPDLS